jgi:hypothetical protein
LTPRCCHHLAAHEDELIELRRRMARPSHLSGAPPGRPSLRPHSCLLGMASIVSPA